LAGNATSADFPTTLGAFQNSNPIFATSFKIFVSAFNASELKSLSPTIITLTSDANPQKPGVPITFTATVQGQPGASTPTGTVSFSVPTPGPASPWTMGPWMGADLDASGKANFTTSALQDGQNTITAFYLGDLNDAPSSGSLIESVASTFTTITVSSNMNPAPYGQPVTFTATVLDKTGKPVPGDVYFAVGGSQYSEALLDSSGKATWETTVGLPFSIPVGVDTLTVQYLASFPQFQDNQATLQQTVTPPIGTSPAPIISPGGGTYGSAQQVILTDSDPKANIYYAVGMQPTALALDLYTSPIQVSGNETINALAIVPGSKISATVSAAYVINPPQADFSISISPSSLTVNSGHSASTAVTVSPTNGFAALISFTCSGLPAGSTCTFSPQSVAPGGTNAATTLTISASAMAEKDVTNDRPFMVIPVMGALLICVGRTRRRLSSNVLALLLSLVAMCLLSACGGSGNSGAQPPPVPTTSTVTVTASAGQTPHSASLSLTVN
jgi:hypothetical protein